MAFLTNVFASLVGVLDCAGKVHHREQAENESLDKTGKKPQNHHRHGRKVEPGQEKEDAEDQFFTKYVSEKTDRQTQDPRDVPDYFNGQDKRNEPPYGTHKMLDILDPVEFDSQHVGRYDDNQRTRSRGIEIGRRRSKSRNHSQVVAAKDKKPEARNEWKHEAAFLASDADHKIFHARYHQFEEILSTLGNHFEVANGKGAQTHQQQYD